VTDFLEQIGSFTSEIGAEIVTYDPTGQLLFVVSGDLEVQVLDVSDPTNPVNAIPPVPLTDFAPNAAGANSVAFADGILAIAIEVDPATDPGLVALVDVAAFGADPTAPNAIQLLEAGALPDMVTFSPDGNTVLVANEGEPNEDYTIDPEGSVGIIDLADGVGSATITIADFSAFNDQADALREAGVRIFGLNASVAQDLEPEFITVSPDSSTAYVALQENNTLAVVDIDAGEVTELLPLGVKDYSQEESPLDASNEDGGINIRNWPVFGLYQPDAIASYEVNGETFIVTANEGDARLRPDGDLEDEDGNVIIPEGEIFNEESRIADVELDPEAFPNAEELQLEENLGRLLITNTLGDTDGDGDFDQLFSFGGRSFSIRDSEGNLVFDSDDDFAQITAEQVPEIFNSNGTPDTFDERSDDKGAEPEALTLGTIGDRTYAFIGLERTGGIMVYDITSPTTPSFIDYIDYFADAPGNIGPEGFEFISADASPTGENLLVVANEVSSTVAVFAVNPGVRISDIQGAGHISPLEGEMVADVPGIVTAVDSNGFYLQDPTPDANPETSEGIFVFTGDAPTVSVGDAIEVSGIVSEFIPGGPDTGNLSITQISGDVEITVLSTDNELPEAVILGEPGRVPPDMIIDNDGLALFDPEQDGIDFYETVEGMRVTINDPLAVSPTNRFGEIFTVANNGASATGLSDRGTLNIDPNDFNPERIQIQFDDGILPDFEQIVDVGAQLEDVTGVVGYAFGNYEVNVTEPFDVADPSSLTPEESALAGTEDELTFATYNVLNLDPNDDDGDTDVADGNFTEIAQQIVENLNGPDIIALQEVQDNDGSVMSDVTTADETLQLLVDEIAAISGITYEFIDNPFIGDDTSGGQPGGNIRTAYLYNPQRVDFVEGSLDPIVEPENQQTDPDNPFFDSRLPLAATFTFNGEDITLVNNHFSSKGGSSPLFGAVQPATELQEDPDVNGSLDERRDQAAAVQEFVDNVLAEDPDANIAVLGDLNEFEFISAVEILEEDLVNLTETLPPNERYTFIFQGNSQSLDHILVSENLAATAEFDIVHVNVEFAEAASDHEPLLAQVTFGEDDPDATQIDFDNLEAGTAIADQFADQGLTISTDGEFGAMIFDTANPTGGDNDLASDELGAVLIISEDGDTTDPDDNAGGGTLSFEFDELVGISRVGLLDIDEPGSSITFYDSDGEVLETVEIPELRGNSIQQILFDIDGVGRVDIALAGSGAVTGLDFTSMGDTEAIASFSDTSTIS